jgi:hypothetical protein
MEGRVKKDNAALNTGSVTPWGELYYNKKDQSPSCQL